MKILILVIIIVALILENEDYEKYNKLDKVGCITNIILSILYIPLSIMGVMSIMVSDALSGNVSVLEEFLINFENFTKNIDKNKFLCYNTYVRKKFGAGKI